MSTQLLALLKKYGISAVCLIVAFAAGRYTMRSSVEKETDIKYSEQYQQLVVKSELDYKQKLKEETESIRKQLELITSKVTEIDRTTTTKPDGTVIVNEHKKIDSDTKQTIVVTDDKKSSEVSSETKVSKESDVKKGKVDETVKTVETITPPPSWRVYASTSIRDPLGARKIEYGAGGMYDLGPINCGVFGLGGVAGGDKSLGVSLGLSF